MNIRGKKKCKSLKSALLCKKLYRNLMNLVKVLITEVYLLVTSSNCKFDCYLNTDIFFSPAIIYTIAILEKKN